MLSHWDIKGQDIALWASRIEAAAVLPELLRRLLLATGVVQQIEVRADSGVRLGGWDGVVLANDTVHPFCPPRLSVWELSVQGLVGQKLDADFDKRSNKPPPPVSQTRLATYVVLTARRFPAKQKWVTDKKRLGQWADVRVYDADDIATWLGQSTVVARWFAGKMGLPAGDLAYVQDVETFLRNWSNRTQPALPQDVVLAGRDRQHAHLLVRTWLSSSRPSALHVNSETREEAIVFAAAALAHAPSEERDRWLSRAAVVESREAWRWLTNAPHDSPPILLPLFEDFEPAEAVGRGFVIIPWDATHQPKQLLGENRIILEPIPRDPLAKKLVHAGMREPDAERLARESGGKLGALQRLCGYADLPGWTNGVNRNTLFAMLLVGAWSPSNTADREVSKRLGVRAEDMEALCVELSQRSEQPIRRDTEKLGSVIWRWFSVADAWHALARGLTDTQVQAFSSIAIEVLGETDPKYDLSKDERWYAAAQGKVLKHSEALREGVAESIVRLALSDEELAKAVGTPRGSQNAAWIITRLLEPEWKRWASLSDVLPILAEAAPEQFIASVEKSLNRQDGGVSHLLEEEARMGSSPHTGLLWALEALGWRNELMPRVAFALAALAARDPGGQLANRPLRSLENLLHDVFPQTNAPVDDRLQVLTEIVRRWPKVGWDLAIARVKDQRGMGVLFPSHRPKYRKWELPSESQGSTQSDWLKQIAGTVDVLLSAADLNPVRWAALLDAAFHLPTAFAGRVLDALQDRREALREHGIEIWSGLRHFIIQARRSRSFDMNLMFHAKTLHDAFAPHDIVSRVSWLFETAPEHIELESFDWRASEVLSEKKRAEAVEKIWIQTDRLTLLGRLADKSERAANQLGATLAHASFVNAIETHVLEGSITGTAKKFIPSFIATRLHIAPKDMQWLEGVLNSLTQQGNYDLALQTLLHFQKGKEQWELLERLGEPLRSDYWRRVSTIFSGHSPEEYEWAIARLLEVSRPFTAAQAAQASDGKIATATTLSILESIRDLRAKPSAGQEQLNSYLVEQLFLHLDTDPTIAPERIAGLELFFLRHLEDTGRSAQHLFGMLGDSPALFVKLIEAQYRPEGTPPPEASEVSEETSRIAENAFTVLDAWDSYPGEDLPDAEKEETLLNWASAALDLATQSGRGPVAQIEVAKVLARPHAASDGIWPCRAARELLRRPEMEHFASGLKTAKLNMRGVWTKGLQEGGRQERALAEEFYAGADRLRISWSETAALLRELAAGYEEDAARADAEASSERLRHGWEKENVALPASSSEISPADTQSIQVEALRHLQLRHVDVASQMTFDFASRLNLLTGDNSTGKTLVLDVLWWCLTSSWPTRQMVRPTQEQAEHQVPSIVLDNKEPPRIAARYDRAQQDWKRPPEWPQPTGSITLYARVDGGFSVWDPLRGKALDFTQRELWHGFLPDAEGKQDCRGLLDDWVDWQFRQQGRFDVLKEVLTKLSVDEVPLKPGPPSKVFINDPRDYPTIDAPYGRVVLTHASAAVKRVVGLAYLLVWTWREHESAARMLQREPIRHLVFLADEIESHLHPKWQRLIVPALIEAVRVVSSTLSTQLFVSTHSPLVTASLEPLFNEDSDKVLRFQFGESGKVEVQEFPWSKQGDVTNWLLSEVFSLDQARNKPAEEVIAAAESFMAGNPQPPLDTWKKIDDALRQHLPGLDPFWPRWIAETEAGK